MIKLNDQLKPLFANLLRVDVVKYIYSDNFRYLCIELKIDEIWDKICVKHIKDSLYIPKRYENSFIELVSICYEHNTKSFFNLISAVILDYAKNVKVKLNFSPVLNELLKLDMNKMMYDMLLKELENIDANKKNVSITDVKITENGIFTSGQNFDALKHIDAIISKSKKEIILIDGYIDNSIFDLFTDKVKQVEVKILTKSKSFTPKVNKFVHSFNKQYGGIEVRISEDFHDRFIIVDRESYYTLGASVKDAGSKTFMFAKLVDEFMKSTLQKKFDEEWNRLNNN